MSTYRNILRNGLATALQKIVIIGQHLILLPFFLKFWGSAYYGEWLTLSAIPSALAFTDLGLGTAVANSFALCYLRGDRQGASNYLKTGDLFISTSCIIVFILLSATLLSLHQFGVFDKLTISSNIAIPSIILVFLARMISFFGALNTGIFRAARKAHYAINISTGVAASRIILGIIILKAGGDALAYATMDFAVSLTAGLASRPLAKMHLKDLPNGKLITNLSELRSLLKRSISYMLVPIRSATSVQGTTIICRIILGPDAVTIFNTVRTLCNTANQAFTTINSSVFPEMQAAVATDKRTSAIRIHLYSIFVATVAALIISVALYSKGPQIYLLWTQGSLAPPRALWLILLISLIFNATWWTATSAFYAFDKPERVSYFGIISAFAGVLVSAALGNYLGITGIAAGILVMEAMMGIYVIPASIRLLDISREDIKNTVTESRIVFSQFSVAKLLRRMIKRINH